MPSAPTIAACKPVPQACCRSKACVYGDSGLPSTDSRVRLKSRLSLSTAPAMTAPRRSPLRLKRSDAPVMAAVNMSWLEAFA
ncbi:Uncharacterised protein [Mycobacteroides abscessus subsp. abscessus]|nr:Uncharacterised protein [Mycobacteroides abscessus subsp. abscessus]